MSNLSEEMKVLVTGAKGFVGRNLCEELKNIRDGKARHYGDLSVDQVYEYDIDSTREDLDRYCSDADFVFNLAGSIALRTSGNLWRETSASPLHSWIP